MFGAPTKSSVYLRRHLDGSGNGFDLDDLITRDHPANRDAAKAVVDLMEAHRSLGLNSPAARASLEALAAQLEQEGK